MYFPEEQSEQKPGLYHSQTYSPGAVVNKPGLSSFAPLFSRAPYTRKNDPTRPLNHSGNVQAFPTTIGQDPGGC